MVPWPRLLACCSLSCSTPVRSPLSTQGICGVGVADYGVMKFWYRVVLRRKVIVIGVGGRSIFVWETKSCLVRCRESLLVYLQ